MTPNTYGPYLRIMGFYALLLGGIHAAHSSTSLMSTEWAEQACEAWNMEPALTETLAESGWADNDNGRGYKLIELYRSNCPNSPRVQLRISVENDKAKCLYGGGVDNEPDLEVDYIMYAETGRWVEMGRGEYGPMRGMMYGRLKFKGPKWEAMKNMGPFERFLLLIGKVQSDASSCP
ncbi:MAG: SCP2 sterol-binding domain-containing protein [Gammaproteobacteria bacterium]|nr:SCP2 sterol-binding domain-containing protein [Gammaproteobacteria bacterium]